MKKFIYILGNGFSETDFTMPFSASALAALITSFKLRSLVNIFLPLEVKKFVERN